jgi:hypothetical protein
VCIAKEGGIAPLIALVKEGSAGGKEQAEGALKNLAVNAGNKKAVLDLGGLKVVEEAHAENKESKNTSGLLNALKE